jgi:hypothetical protein
MTFEPTASGARVLLRYRNREITQGDVEFLRRTCAAEWGGRFDLCRAVCEFWGWRAANGGLAIHACLDLLLRLEERGHIELPLSKRAERVHFASVPIPVDLIPLVGLDARDPEADLARVSGSPDPPRGAAGMAGVHGAVPPAGR